MSFANLESVRMVKNCDLAWYGPPSRQITYIYFHSQFASTKPGHESKRKTSSASSKESLLGCLNNGAACFAYFFLAVFFVGVSLVRPYCLSACLFTWLLNSWRVGRICCKSAVAKTTLSRGVSSNALCCSLNRLCNVVQPVHLETQMSWLFCWLANRWTNAMNGKNLFLLISFRFSRLILLIGGYWACKLSMQLPLWMF